MTLPSHEDLDRIANEGILEPPDEDEEEDQLRLIQWADFYQFIWYLLLRRSYQHGGYGR